jgi:NAD(P)-dependent dehydrogenase (short-subunit alcohol dehydrogenase family)
LRRLTITLKREEKMASTLNSKVIVVLGGTGGIGSQLCRDLREAGARLACY